MNDVGVPAGWYRDPTGQGSGRYWNGVSWTEMVDRGGTTINLPIDPAQARTPPVPGTQIAAPVVYPAGQAANGSTPNRTGLGLIIGGIIVAVIGVVILAVVAGDSSDDTPTPGTDAPAVSVAPPGTDAPAAPSTDGG